MNKLNAVVKPGWGCSTEALQKRRFGSRPSRGLGLRDLPECRRFLSSQEQINSPPVGLAVLRGDQLGHVIGAGDQQSVIESVLHIIVYIAR